MRITVLLFLIVGYLINNLSGQNAPITNAPQITCGAGTNIDIPITVSDFNNIGALSLTLHYDGSVLNYQSFSNNSGFPSLLINGAVAGEITASGLNFVGPGITLPDNSILFTLTFFCIEGSSELQWFDNGLMCEYTDDQFNPLNDSPTCLYYQNGAVNDNSFHLQLKVFLEGPFNDGEMSTTLKGKDLVPNSQPYSGYPWYYDGMETVSSVPENVVDWVLVELRESTGDATTATPDKIIARQAGFLMKDGFIKYINDCSSGNMKFSVSFSDNLYIVIYHRNHIAAISANPLTLFNGNGNYDFSSGENKALGGSLGHKEISPGIWGLASGDSNGDGYVDLLDKQNEWDQIAGSSGYYSSDFSFDSQIDNNDKNELWVINFGFTCQVP